MSLSSDLLQAACEVSAEPTSTATSWYSSPGNTRLSSRATKRSNQHLLLLWFFFFHFKPMISRAPADLVSPPLAACTRWAGVGGLQPLDPCVDRLRYLMQWWLKGGAAEEPLSFVLLFARELKATGPPSPPSNTQNKCMQTHSREEDGASTQPTPNTQHRLARYHSLRRLLFFPLLDGRS